MVNIGVLGIMCGINGDCSSIAGLLAKTGSLLVTRIAAGQYFQEKSSINNTVLNTKIKRK